MPPVVTESAGVKTYSLSSVGKALPAWVGSKRKAAQAKKTKEKADGEVEVIQDLFFPTACARVKVSSDGEHMFATGGYPPQLRAYELRELSLRFCRNFVADVVQFQILSSDWRKAAFLLADRTVEFHSQFGKHHCTRIPHFGRAMAYQPEMCELLLAGAGEEIFRLSLERGSFLTPLRGGCSGINVLGVHPSHGMVVAGTARHVTQTTPRRTRARVGRSRSHVTSGAHRPTARCSAGTRGSAPSSAAAARSTTWARARRRRAR
jgi:ribosome biogenesis protein ENP2